MIISDKIYIKKYEIGSHISNICELFTYKNPEYYHKKRLKLSVRTTPVSLFHYKIDGEYLILPRGGLSKLMDYAKEKNLALRYTDKTITCAPIDCYMVDTVLHHEQEGIVSALTQNFGGLIEAPPGGGKTIAILNFICKIKQPVLIMMHEHRLRSQWENEIIKRVKGNYTLGRLDGDEKRDGDIVTAIINSVYIQLDSNPEYLNKFGMVIIDECHAVVAHMYLSVINNISAKYRVGITGTVERKDGRHILMYDVLGKVIKKVKTSDIKERITNFTFKVINTNLPLQLDTTKRWTGSRRENVLDYTKFLGKLVENKERNTIIVEEVVNLIELGYFPLILSSRVQHLKDLHEWISSLGYKSILLIGENRKQTNWIEIQKDLTIQCICANDKIASEGLDAPRLSALVLTCPTGNFPKLEQKIGRVRRTYPNKKEPLIVDVCDNLAYLDEAGGRKHILKYSALKRIKFYQKLQHDYDNVF